MNGCVRSFILLTILALPLVGTDTLTAHTIYRSLATGDWANAAGGIWELSTDDGGTWTIAGAYRTPGSGNDATIRSGHVITISGTSSVQNLTIESNARLKADADVPTLRTFRVYGTTVTNDGIMGGTGGGNGINIEPATAAPGNVTFTGTGTYDIGRLRPYSVASLTITVARGMTINYIGYGLQMGYAGETGASHTFIINSGVTLSFAAGSKLGTGSNGSGGPNSSTLQIDGTVTLNGGSVNLTSQSVATTLTVNGTFNVGGNLTPAPGLTGGTSTITVNGGGTLNLGTGTADFSVATNAITGAGTVVLPAAGQLNIGSTSGITGNIQTTALNLNSGANYAFVGAAAQVTSTGLPSTVNNLTIDNAAGVTLTNGVTVNGTLALTSGALALDGNTIAYGPSGTLVYNGAASQTTSDAEFPASNGPLNLTIDNAFGVNLHASRTINGALTFAGGKITLGTSSLTAASVSGGSASSYVVTDNTGVLTINNIGNSDVKFPVGPAASYNPVTINNSGTAGDFSVSVKTTFDNAPYSTAAVGRQWSIAGPASGANAAITLQWNSGDTIVGSTFVLTDPIYIGRHNGTQWEATSATCTDLGGGVHTASASGFTAFSPFGVGNISGLPIQLASFTATAVGEIGVRVEWVTLSEVSNYGFIVQRRMATEQAFTELQNGFVPGHGTTNVPHHYQYTDLTAGRGSWYYRLKQIDLDNTTHYTDPIRIDVLTDVKELAPTKFSLSQNYPNPFNPQTSIKFSVEKSGRAILEVCDVLGRRVAVLFDDVAESGQYYSVVFDAGAFGSGVYFYSLQSGRKSDLKKLLLLK